MNERSNILEVRNLRKVFPIQRGLLRRRRGSIAAVSDVSFQIRHSETLALVGESGCGKSTTGRLVVRALKPTSGEILLSDGQDLQPLHEAEGAALKALRRNVQMIFQDPNSSLSPRMTVRDIIAEPLVLNGRSDRRAVDARIAELMDMVGLPRQYLGRYAYAFSGGQRQRIGIARALALEPSLIVADEAVSALDVSIQAQILNLLKTLQAELNLSYLFISHDLRVVEHISSRVAVMYAGHLIELAPTKELFARPLHPYSEALLSAIPSLKEEQSERIVLQGEVADPADLPSGCVFHPRCRYAQPICKQIRPELVRVGGGEGEPRFAACHFSESLSLQGVNPPAASIKDVS